MKYIKPKLKEDLNSNSKALISDLVISIVGQIRVFQGKSTSPGAIYGLSSCLRMMHEHFEAGYTKDAIKHLNKLNIDPIPRSIRGVYYLNSKINKEDRKLYVEHTDGGVKKLAVDLLGLYQELSGNEEDYPRIMEYIKMNTFFIIKHKEIDKGIDENYSLRDKI